MRHPFESMAHPSEWQIAGIQKKAQFLAPFSLSEIRIADALFSIKRNYRFAGETGIHTLHAYYSADDNTTL